MHTPEHTLKNIEFKIQWNVTNRRWLQAELEFVHRPDNISKYKNAPDALKGLIERSTEFIEEAKDELRVFSASALALGLNPTPICYWHGCENVALCRSSNAGGALVCKTHFDITNGKRADELDAHEVANIIRMKEIEEKLNHPKS